MVLLNITKPFDYRLDHNTTIAYQVGELQVEDAVAAKALELGGHILPLLEQHSEAENSRESTLHLQALLSFALGEKAEAAALLGTLHQEFSSSIVRISTI